MVLDGLCPRHSTDVAEAIGLNSVTRRHPLPGQSQREGTHKEGMEQPKKFYIPSIAPGSLMQYTGEAFPEWQGDLFAGALKLRHINRIELDEEGNAIAEERLMEDLNERIRALLQSPEGWIYFSTDSGNIYVIKP